MGAGTKKIFFAVLRSAIRGEVLTDELKALYSQDELPQLAALAKKHDVLQLLAYGLLKNGLVNDEKLAKKLDNSILNAVYRQETQSYELGRICEALEKAQLPFIPLKGSVIREYYPEPWMRTSCDIDVLVHEEDAEKAKSVLVDELGYTCEEGGSHDISLFSPANVHLELHYGLIEDGIVNNSFEVLKSVWDVCNVKNGHSYWCEMPASAFYFYHVAHMAKHFRNGGCGIRPFIDLWLLDSANEQNGQTHDDLLSRGELLKFANAARKLSKVWFDNEQYDKTSELIEDFILHGGVYGTMDNQVIVQQQEKGGKLKYLLSRVFLPYERIKAHYPIVEKHKWLTPFMNVRRWFKLIFCGHLKNAAKEIHYNQSVTKKEALSMQELLKNIGL